MSAETCLVKKRDIAQAYEAWKQRNAYFEDTRPEFFKKRFEARFRLEDLSEQPPNLPSTRSTWWDWLRAEDKSVRFSQLGCQIIFDMTGYVLGRQDQLEIRRNFTSAITLTTSPTCKSISNEPDTNGKECYIVSIPRIQFRKSKPQKVLRAWLGFGGKSGEIQIGTVVFAIRQAILKVETMGDVIPKITLLKPEDSSNAEGVLLVDELPGRWVVDTESERGHLIGSLNLPDIANVWKYPSERVHVSVEVHPDAVEPIFSGIKDELSELRHLSKARDHLIAKVLKLAITDDGENLVFSRAEVEENG